jgi:hypothetical protein
MKVNKVLMMGAATLGLATFANAGVFTETFSITGLTNYTNGSTVTTDGVGQNYSVTAGTPTGTAVGNGLLPYFGVNGEVGTLTGVTISVNGAFGQSYVLHNTTGATANGIVLAFYGEDTTVVNSPGAPTIDTGNSGSPQFNPTTPLVNGYSNAPGITNVNLGEFPQGTYPTVTLSLGNNCYFGAGTAAQTGNPANGSGGALNCYTTAVSSTIYATFGTSAYCTAVSGSGGGTCSTPGSDPATPSIAGYTYVRGPQGFDSTITERGSDASQLPQGFQTESSTGYTNNTISVTYTYSTSSGTPEPVSMILFGSGLTAVALIGRKKFKRS